MLNIWNTAPRRASRLKRFSIRLLLGVISFVALSLGIWKTFVYEPPTHEFPAYEKAPWTRGLEAKIGPNMITLRSVARNDRDGRLHVESGKGDPLPRSVPDSDGLVSSGDWLDVVQFELSADPGSFEIADAKVFDHLSRTLLPAIDPAFGWRVIGPNFVQVYGLGKEVPPLMDVWLRVRSYPAGDQASIVPLQAGAKFAIPGAELTLREVQRGFAGWSTRAGFWPVADDDDSTTALVLEWDAARETGSYQISALSIFGEKQFAGRLLRVGHRGEKRHLVLFDFPLDEIKSVELRPYAGEHRFFFEAVELPKISGQSFHPPPNARVAVDGSETQAVLTELAPLRVRIAVMKGDAASGSFSNGRVSRIKIRSEPQEPDNMLTLLFNVSGISELPIAVRMQDSRTGQFAAESSFQPRSRFRASGATTTASAHTFRTPLDRVEAVEVAVGASP